MNQLNTLTLIINGRYHLPPHIKQEIEVLGSSGLNITQLITTPQTNAEQLARKAVKDSCELMIVCGGDGTVNEVINGVMGCDIQHRSNLVLSILPLGSGNDFSRSVGQFTTLRTIIEHYQQDTTRRIDLGLLRFQSPEKQPVQRYFINICDIGIGGYVAETVNRRKKWFGPALAYHAAIIQALLRYRNTEVTMQSDLGSWQGTMLNLVLANGRYFGHGLCIAPEAELSDSHIQMVRLGKVSLFDYVRHLGKLKRCDVIKHPEAHYQKIKYCSVDSPIRPVPVEMDGEFVGYTPVEMSICPAEINFIFLQV